MVEQIRYCILMLTEFDYLSVVWVQLPKSWVDELKKGRQLMQEFDGHQYTTDGGVEMAEYHIDHVTKSEDLPELQGNAKGGNLSVRKSSYFLA